MRPLQKEIIETLKVKSSIDPQGEIRNSVNFLKDYLIRYPFLNGYVLGISGGQDSTLSGILAQMAVDELNQEQSEKTYSFYAIRLPYGVQADEQDAMDAIAFMKAEQVLRVDIKPAVDATWDSLVASGMTISDFNKGNIKARQRMIVQYAIAGQTNCAVIGTDHAAESVTGFYTKFGDGGADILPIWRLNKAQGREMLQVLGAPTSLYEKIPTADLEDDRPSLPDEVALGVTYQDIDAYLEGKEITEASAQTIESWYIRTQHKRHLPITLYDTWWK
ncbi:ammonia-dependent NAD(+) synthetase [Granulicatella seriolae]|uniref:NH(3)-dependent NAD(+) synthetase n=1 Tax=Granulicatella seriolae TaxID=2967226 RepID=A0ABT1WP30_9LACT|nr:ammonia-dependent NAD(+) synthetase [Granulicatella seriolae]